MKAIVFTKYGFPDDVLGLEDVEQPVPKADEVLIEVCTTSVNDWDWSFVRGKPLAYRLMFGLFKPKVRILGVEVAGVVRSVGSQVTKFRPGDAVYGDISEAGMGGFAEYVCVREDALGPKPAAMTFEQAAAMPHAAMLALQGLIDVGQLQEGQKLLINGAGGGVGTLGVQIAKQYNVEATGVDSGAKLDLLRSMGFDHVIDYQQEDFTETGQRYDLIFDTKTTRSTFGYLRALNPGGRYVTVGGYLPKLLQAFCLGPWISRFSDKRANIVALKPNKDLAYVNRLFEAGKLRCAIDGPYTLAEIPKALMTFGEGTHRGKMVIRVKAEGGRDGRDASL